MSGMSRANGESAMNCYLCFRETGSATHPAVAICQHCGVGMCEFHLVAPLGWQHVSPVGMAGAFSVRRLMCSHCYGVAFLPSRTHKPAQPKKGQGGKERGSSGQWWKWLWKQRPSRSSELPQSEEAVAFVENYLKRQRSG